MTDQHPTNRKPFGFLLLLCSLFSVQLLPGFFSSSHQSFLIVIVLTAILLSSLYLVADSRRHITIGVIVAIPALMFTWGVSLIDVTLEVALSLSLYIILMTYVIVYLIRYLARVSSVDLNMLFAAVCVYLLLGLVWALIYTLIELYTPGSFRLVSAADASFEHYRLLLGEFSYYSYVTLSTLGYGDVTPVSRLARSWSTLEAITGQLYLAIIIARLVGQFISDQQNKQSQS